MEIETKTCDFCGKEVQYWVTIWESDNSITSCGGCLENLLSMAYRYQHESK